MPHSTSSSSIQQIVLEDCSGNAGTVLYIDQVQLTTAAYTTDFSGPTPPPTPAPTPPPNSYVLFGDAVNTQWTLTSSGILSLYTADKYSGTTSEKLVTTGTWQNYGFYTNTPITTKGYTHFQFAVKSGQSNSVCFQSQVFRGAWNNSLPVASTANYGGYPVNSAWSLYTIPMTAYGNPTAVSVVLLADCSDTSGSVFYLDQVVFLQ
jgi:hypothetical protein